MTAVFIVFGIIVIILFIVIGLLILYENDMHKLIKLIFTFICILGIGYILLVIGLEHGEKVGHKKIYQGNPKYKMEILYNKYQEPVDTLYIQIKK
jgi:multisubunit Na+/H+ antiporter MnhC subunit